MEQVSKECDGNFETTHTFEHNKVLFWLEIFAMLQNGKIHVCIINNKYPYYYYYETNEHAMQVQ